MRSTHSGFVRQILTGAVMAALVNTPSYSAEVRSTLADQKNVAVTIYNTDLALVKEQRIVKLGAGVIDLALRDVSARMRPETASLRGLSNNDFNVLEQNFDFDLLTPAALLQKFVGREVGVVRTHPTTGAETIERAEILSAASGAVLKIGDRIEVGVPGRIIYDKVPDNLRDRPTLVTKIDNTKAGEQLVELAYLTGGLNWRSDFVAELDQNDQSMSLKGWVTLTNQSGTTYQNATLQLVAGDVNRVQDKIGRLKDAPAVMAEMAKRKYEEMDSESLFEYHLYSLPRATTIKDNSSKQVSLLQADRVVVNKELILNGYDFWYRSYQPSWSGDYKVAVMVNFENKEKSGLGKPLPKGTVRVYKRDDRGNTQFIGEDAIDHTPKNENVKLRLGSAFDVTAEHKQTEWRKADAVGKYSYASESAYEIKIKNAKKEPVVVKVREPIPGDWTILRFSQPFEQEDAHTATWKVSVPAEGSTTLTYRALVRY